MNVTLAPRIAADGVVIYWHWQHQERLHRLRPHAIAALALAGFGTPNVRPVLQPCVWQPDYKRDLIVRELSVAGLIDAALQLTDTGVAVLALYRLAAAAFDVDPFLRRGACPRRKPRAVAPHPEVA